MSFAELSLTAQNELRAIIAAIRAGNASELPPAPALIKECSERFGEFDYRLTAAVEQYTANDEVPLTIRGLAYYLYAGDVEFGRGGWAFTPKATASSGALTELDQVLGGHAYHRNGSLLKSMTLKTPVELAAYRAELARHHQLEDLAMQLVAEAEDQVRQWRDQIWKAADDQEDQEVARRVITLLCGSDSLEHLMAAAGIAGLTATLTLQPKSDPE